MIRNCKVASQGKRVKETAQSAVFGSASQARRQKITASCERVGRQWRVGRQGAVAKLGFPDATGVVEWRRRDGLVVRLETSRRPGDYPDGGCPVELWLQHPLPAPAVRQFVEGLQKPDSSGSKTPF